MPPLHLPGTGILHATGGTMKEYAELKRDLWIGTGTLVVSLLLFLAIRFTISEQSFTGISGRAFPYVINGLLAVLGLALTLDSFLQLRKAAADNSSGDRPGDAGTNWKNLSRIGVYFLLVCLYVTGISYIGFVVSRLVFTAAILVFYRLGNKLAFAIITCGCAPILWFVFDKLVGFEFPHALLF